MNFIQKKVMEFALSRPYIKTAINKVINDHVESAVNNQVGGELSRLTRKVDDMRDSSGVVKKRKYLSTSNNESILGKKISSGKNFNVLETLYSESPGSIQCADRTIDAVIGTGYTIKEEILGKKGSKQDLKKLIAFFDRVNSEGYTIEDFVTAGLENLLAYGNWYTEKVNTRKGADDPNSLGNLAEIYHIDARTVKILVDDEKRKKGVNIKVGYTRTSEYNGKEIIYKDNELLHIKMPSRSASLYGDAVLEDSSALLMMLITAINYNMSMMRNGGYINFKVKLPDDSSETDAESVEQWLIKNYMGSHNAGKPLVLFKGADASPIGLSPNEMQYLDLLNYGIRQVSGMYGVPLILIGHPEGSNRSTASEVRKAFYQTKVFPLRDKIAAQITNEVIKRGMGIEGYRFSFKSAALEESESSRRDTMSAVKMGMMTFNEGRGKIGLQPVDEEWANKYYLVSSKNDLLFPIETAVERGQSAEVESESMNQNPDDDGNREQGEGADESEE